MSARRHDPATPRFARRGTARALSRRRRSPAAGALAVLLGCGNAEGEPATDTTGSTGPGPADGTDDTDDDGGGNPGPGTAAPGDDTTAGGMGDATAADTNTDTDDEGSTGAPPVQTVPVFVALADGGWMATSCDGGQSWTHTAFSDEAGDHTPWTAFGGVAFGAEAFVAGFGWGAPGSLVHSPDGITWTPLEDSAFVQDGTPVAYDSWTAGVVHTDTQFLAFASTRWASPDGLSWTATDISLPPGSEQLRQIRAFPDGLIVASVESQSGNDHPQGHFVVVSEDEGMSWTEGEGYAPNCSQPIQHWGDIELRDDTLLVGTRDVCRSLDRGLSWDAIAEPTGGEVRDLFADDDAFFALSGSHVWRSEDGAAWTDIADVGTNLRAAAYGDGAYAAVAEGGTAFFFSDDAVTWQPAVLDWAPEGDRAVRDFVVGTYPAACASPGG
jgi:hypothetical protein